jgi:hypothetical protein
MNAPPSRPKAYSYIRMSTDLQLKGDSLRRQLEKSTVYAEENDLDLVDESRLQDIGISPARTYSSSASNWSLWATLLTCYHRLNAPFTTFAHAREARATGNRIARFKAPNAR